MTLSNRRLSIGVSILFFLVLILFSGSIASAQQENNEKISFEQANALFSDGNYHEAARAYESLLKRNNNTVVMYNLGNAWFRCWQESSGTSDEAFLGKAILAWEKVLYSDPRNNDAAANLSYARTFVQDKFDSEDDNNPIWKALGTIWRFPSVTEVEVAFSVLLWLTALVIMALRRAKGAFWGEAGFWLLFLLIPLTIFLGCWSYLRAYEFETTREAVILARETDVTSAPNLEEKRLYSLHEGVKVSVSKASSGWCKIILPNGSPGWVRQEHLGFIQSFVDHS